MEYSSEKGKVTLFHFHKTKPLFNQIVDMSDLLILNVSMYEYF